MGLFTRRAKPIVSPETLAVLGEYGRREFERSHDENMAPALLVSKLQYDPKVTAEPLGATDEVCRAASIQGGWALYGAWTAVHAFIPAGTDTSVYQQTMDDSLTFIRQLRLPATVLGGRMRMDATTRWRQLFPDDPLG